jgi:stage II sporulation protein D
MVAGFLMVSAASNQQSASNILLSSKVNTIMSTSQNESLFELTSSYPIYSSSIDIVSSSVSSALSISSSSLVSSKLSSSKYVSSSSKKTSKPSSSSKLVSSKILSSSSTVPQASSQINSGTLPSETFTVSSNYGVISLPRHDLICENIAWELGGNFSNETTKAFAVACYTYIKYSSKLRNANVLLLSKDDAKVKWGKQFDTYWNKIDKAVTEVEGQYSTKDNKNPIEAVFFVSSAGKTETATNVWGGTKDAFGNSNNYLASVDSSWDSVLDKKYHSNFTFSSDIIKNLASTKLGITLTGDPAFWFKDLKLDSAGYVATIQLGGKTVTGRDIREKMFDLTLRSTAFTVSYANETFTFATTGYGHGVGLSTYGAEYLSTVKGWDYSKILAYYYTGTTLMSIK